jgi:hypothetical protein
MRKSVTLGIVGISCLIALLVVDRTAFAQAGSTGGTVGKSDKSISGGKVESDSTATAETLILECTQADDAEHFFSLIIDPASKAVQIVSRDSHRDPYRSHRLTRIDNQLIEVTSDFVEDRSVRDGEPTEECDEGKADCAAAQYEGEVTKKAQGEREGPMGASNRQDEHYDDG